MTGNDFVGYPEKHVLAAFDSREDAAAAIDDALESGVPERDLGVYSGEEGASEISSSGVEQGISGVIVRSLQSLVSNRDSLASYDEAVRGGAVVIAGLAEDDDRKHTLSSVFQRHNGRDVRYFGAMVVEDLSVDPSRTRAD